MPCLPSSTPAFECHERKMAIEMVTTYMAPHLLQKDQVEEVSLDVTLE